MKVFILVEAEHEYYTILGVYTTYKLAEKQIQKEFKRRVKFSNTKDYEYKLIQDDVETNEYELFRYKTHDFNDGLVNKNFITAYVIEERDVIDNGN